MRNTKSLFILICLSAFTGCSQLTSPDLEKRIERLEKQQLAIARTLGIEETVDVSHSAAEENIPVGTSPIIGKRSAPLTLVAFMDFECGFCARYYGAVPEALKLYPDELRVVIKHFPLTFRGEAVPAAKAALAANRQGKYAEMVEALLENQKDLRQRTYENIAEQLDLDIQQFQADLKEDGEELNSQIQADLKLGATIGVKGTPSFFLNGKPIPVRDLPSLLLAIEKSKRRQL